METNTAHIEILYDLPVIGLESGQSIYPCVEHAFFIHKIRRKGPQNKPELTQKLMDYINTNKLSYLYKYACEKGVCEFDQVKFDAMLEYNKKILEAILKRKEEIKEKMDQIAQKELNTYQSNYLSYIGNFTESLQYLKDSYENCSTTILQIENYLHRCRIGFFLRDRKLVGDSLSAVDEMINKANDWHLKNLNYVYHGMFHLWNRDIETACTCFINCLSSFSAYDLMPLSTFCSYTAICSLLTMSREKFHSKIINGSEVQEGLYHAPVVRNLCDAFYSCNYRQFISKLKLLVEEMLDDHICYEHVNFMCKKFRLKAYNQLFVSFKSLTLDYLSDEFGLNVDFIEKDVASFIADGLINCKIDLVNRMVIITQRDMKNKDFNDFIAEYDRCISSIQFLERIIND